MEGNLAGSRVIGYFDHRDKLGELLLSALFSFNFYVFRLHHEDIFLGVQVGIIICIINFGVGGRTLLALKVNTRNQILMRVHVEAVH